MAKESSQEVAVRSSKGQEMQRVVPSRFLSPFEEFDRFFESALPRNFMRPFFREWPRLGSAMEGVMPRIDVIEKDEEIVVMAEVPGVEKKDLDISMTDSSITISGKTNHKVETEKGGSYFCSEITHGEFSRTISLPSDVDVDKAKAVFKDGMLEVDLPKMEKSKRRTIKLD